MRPGIEALSGLPLFRPFDAKLLQQLNELADLARIGPGETLFEEGDRRGELNILTSGYVMTTQAQPEGGEAITDVIAPVRPLAFASALLDRPATVGARTVTSVRLIIIPVAALQAMIAAEPRLGLPFLERALSELHETGLEVARLKLRSSAQRLAAFLVDLFDQPDVAPARFALPYEKRFVAGKIGCSQENLSRAFAALRRIGVETRQGSVMVGDVAALRAFARLPDRQRRRNGPAAGTGRRHAVDAADGVTAPAAESP